MPVSIANTAARMRTCLSVAGIIFITGFIAPTPQALASVQRNPEDLLVVDCLLPGQVRRLGAQSMFMSARRPLRTTQADCEIRGGEYVAYDRANYQTALKVWQGQAELGDVEAQNYVGEIYLKGLGTEPDYNKAAEWFGKAAAQGSKRARINLGYQYEQGLGVPKDPAKAINLYREASGISGDKLVFASEAEAEVGQAHAESENLREQLAGEQAKSNQLRAQVDHLNSQLKSQQQDYDKSRRQLNDTRTQLDNEQKKLGVDRDPQYAKIKSDLDAREHALSEQQRQLESAKAASVRQQADAEAEVAKLRGREQELQQKHAASNDQDLAALRAQLAQKDAALAQARSSGQQLQQQLGQNEQQHQDAQASFDAARVQLAQEHAKNEESSKLLKLMETQLAEKRQELSGQRSQMAALQTQLETNQDRRAAQAYSTASVGGGLRVEILQPALSVTRGLNKPAASLLPAQNGMDVVGRVVAPAGLTTLSVNDKNVTADSAGNFTVHVAVPIDGTSVRVAALDKHGEKALLDFMLVPAPGAGPGNARTDVRPQIVDTLPHGVQLGKYYALVIGNDTYQSYPALKSAGGDAAAIAALLKSRYGYEVHSLTNANRFEILSALNDMREQLKDNDNLLVYYAGHGELDSSRQGYWLPVDAQANQPSSWISNRAVSDILTTMNAKHVLVIADSCYSGTMTRTSLATFGGGMPADAWGDWVKTMTAGRSRTAMTSGGVQPVPDAATGQHSIFAGALLTILNDNNQLLTGQRLFREVASSMALKGSGAALQQAPEYAPIQFAGHEAGEFFFMPRKTG